MVTPNTIETPELKKGVLAGAAVSAQRNRLMDKGGLPDTDSILVDIVNSPGRAFPPYYPNGIPQTTMILTFKVIVWVDIESARLPVALLEITDLIRGMAIGHYVSSEMRNYLRSRNNSVSNGDLLERLLKNIPRRIRSLFLRGFIPDETIQLAFSMVDEYQLL